MMAIDNNTALVIVAVVGAVSAITSALIGVWNTSIGRSNQQALAATHTALTRLEVQTDGLKDELVRVTGDKAFAEGVKQGTEATAGTVADTVAAAVKVAAEGVAATAVEAADKVAGAVVTAADKIAADKARRRPAGEK